MGIIIGTWFTPPFCRRKDDIDFVSEIAERLRAAMGLRISQAPGGALSLSNIRETLFEWDIQQDSVTVHGFIPAHPYLWENLDAVMAAMGSRRDTAAYKWHANPLHRRLRTRWNALPQRDRFILSVPSFLGARPLDRLLST